MSSGSHLLQNIGPRAAVIDCRWLRMKHEGDGEETFDPLDQLISTMGFERVLDAVSCRHLQDLDSFRYRLETLEFVVNVGPCLVHVIDVFQRSPGRLLASSMRNYRWR